MTLFKQYISTFLKCSIRKKLLVFFVLFFVIPGGVSTLIVYFDTIENVGYTKLNDLMNIVDAKYIHLLDFIDGQKKFISYLGNNDLINEGLQEYYRSKDRKDEEDTYNALRLLDSYLKKLQKNSKLGRHIMEKEREKGIQLKKVFGRDVKWDMYRLNEDLYRYDEIFIMDTRGKVVASSNNKHIGMDMKESGFFVKGREGAYMQDVFKDIYGRKVFGFAAPIVNRAIKLKLTQEGKQFLGVIGVKIGTEFLTDLVTGDIGNRIGGKLFFAGYTPSTDFYIINRDGYMITQSKVLKGIRDTVLEQTSRTLPWERCINSNLEVREAQEFYQNYNGMVVGGASMCVFDMKWTIVAEQDKNEILGLGSRMLRVIMTLCLIVTSMIVLFAVYLSRWISAPIVELSKMAREIEKGNYDVSVDIKSNDEIGVLGEAFNDMARTHKIYNSEINKKKEELKLLNERLKEKAKKEEQAKLSAFNMTEEIKKAKDKLEKTLSELKRSNDELQQFAYVASHDLQEPLRMVSSYVQLLERRYKGRLDPDADDFIAYAVDGANRMHKLINALLEYSRVGTKGREFSLVNSEDVLNTALKNLEIALKESGAEVTHDGLPQVTVDEVQFVQLFQNLISNAVKFRNKEKPRIHISAEKKGNEWVFSVKDNGIGIEKEYFDRIFVIFQRLHGRSEYEGTGIGLSVCKRIVERHGGRIWVESALKKGTTFYFSVPALPLENRVEYGDGRVEGRNEQRL